MTDALPLGERLLALLDESARTSTYKPALLLALIDRAPRHVADARVPVRSLAERVIELYWPQTLTYPATGEILLQNQGSQAAIVRAVSEFRARNAPDVRTLPERTRRGDAWEALVTRVELTLAEWPIPRLQRPFEPFLYSFAWPWQEEGRWSKRSYRETSRVVELHDGVAEGLVALGPLLRPFMTRWWTDKTAQLNPSVPAARSLVEFEEFLFGRDRVALGRVAEGLLDLQRGACFYCGRAVARDREIDHFIPWSYSGDNGVDNLVAACRRCNNDKRATLAGADHVVSLIERNTHLAADLRAIAEERRWPRDPEQSSSVLRQTYLRAPAERPLWSVRDDVPRRGNVGAEKARLVALLTSA